VGFKGIESMLRVSKDQKLRLKGQSIEYVVWVLGFKV